MKLALLSLLLLLAFCAATLAATSGNGSNNGSAATTTPASAQRPPNQVNPAAFNSNDNNNNSASSAMAAPQQQQSVQFQSGGDNCPPLLGNNFPSRQTLTAQGGQSSQSCQWIIISNQQNCPQFFQNCGSNQQMCRSQNEIWWQCTSDCEPSCGNPSPSCRRRCGRSGCQCFPGFLRNQGGFCVPSSQCPSADCSNDNDCPGQSVCVNSQCQQPGCSNDNDCPGSSSICVNRQCRQGCTSDNACAIDAQCSNGRCVERRQCQQDRQCRGQKICFNRQCRLVGSISCRSNFDCPRSAFCGRNGRCFFPNTRAIEDGFDF